MSVLEDTLMLQIRVLKLPIPQREYRFHERRKWRFDFAWPQVRIAAEVEGGTWAGGRHTRPVGFCKDCEKYNSAALLGWIIFRFTAEMIKKGAAIITLEQALQNR